MFVHMKGRLGKECVKRFPENESCIVGKLGLWDVFLGGLQFG